LLKLLCAATLLMGCSALRAEMFTFSYTGVNGTISATNIGGMYWVTDVSGIRKGVAFDASPLGGGSFSYNGSSGFGTIMFSVGSGFFSLPDVVTFNGGSYTDALGGSGTTGFSLVRGVPEPSAILLLLTMGIGVWALLRKLSIRPRSLAIIGRRV
jgi:hypothetical protein